MATFRSILIFYAAWSAGLLAQSASFEVASLKPAPERSGEARFVKLSQTPGRLAYANVTLKLLVSIAYGMDDDKISGGGKWIDSALYDLAAVFPATTRRDQIPTMLKGLLIERFGLVTHTIVKAMPSYSLTIGRTGPQLKSATTDKEGGTYILRGQIIAPRIAMPAFAGLLSRQTGRTVVDETHLEGLYDITLKWTPDNAVPESKLDDEGGSIYSALTEQLGLQLKSGRATTPVTFLVIDRANQVPVE